MNVRSTVVAARAMAVATMPAVLALACSSAPGDATLPDARSRVQLRGHVPAWVERARDLGALAADEPVTHVVAFLARPPDKQQAWENILAAQQTPGSPDYHRWLTPEEIAARFGASPGDLQAVRTWLESQHLRVDKVSRSGGWITFSGTAASIGQTLSTELHRFEVMGEQRISVVSEPTIPASLARTVRFLSGLSTTSPRAQGRGEPGKRSPEYNSFSGKHYVAPGDFAIIYDLDPVYALGLDGAGERIAIAGRSRVAAGDISEFQQETGLPVVAPTVIVPTTGVDPGVTGDGDQLEATLDITRAGSVAPGATIDLVVSGTPSGSMLNGLAIAIEYVIDNDTAPILNVSFYECEQVGGTTSTQFYDTLFQQAAAEGMSVFVCSGDSGAAGCDADGTTPPATQVASPNYICASGSATCVGGTEFVDTSNPATYWSGSNSSVLASVKSYVPEGAWNEPLDSANLPQIWATGGGVSTIVAKPSWQAGPGVPADGFRDTPDIAFNSAEHDGYYACYAAGQGDCSQGSFEYFYGTSAAAPSMAGIAAIADQKAGMRQGNLNPLLYRLAQGASAGAVFHDVTVSTSGVASCSGLPSLCNNSTPGPSGLSGGLVGYTVGAGFDLATGWGSLDVGNLIATFGCVGSSDGTACDDGNACTRVDACHGGLCVGSSPVVCAAEDQCHTAGTCAPATGACSNPLKDDGTSCDDGSSCTQTDACQNGSCVGSDPVVCMALDSCHSAGTCSSATGKCSNPDQPDGTSCDDGNACTQGDTCRAGACAGTAKACAAEDACHSAGTCDAMTGQCSNPVKTDGTACDAGTCSGGVCGATNADDAGSGGGQSSGCGCRVAAASDERSLPVAVGLVALIGLAIRRRAGPKGALTRYAWRIRGWSRHK